MKRSVGTGIAGFAAGSLNGLFGAGGGIVLVPLLSVLTDLEDRELFVTSVNILLPVCTVSLVLTGGWESFSFSTALPYLAGSALGGILAGLLGKNIPSLWLHRGLGLLILWGGVRYLWQGF